MKNPITSTSVSAVIVAAVLAYGIFAYNNTKQVELRNTAIDQCAKISQYIKDDNQTGIKVAYPVVEVYKNCLKDKGIITK